MARRPGNTADPGKGRSRLTGAAPVAAAGETTVAPACRLAGRARCSATRQARPALAGRSAGPGDQGSALCPLRLRSCRHCRGGGAGRHHLQIRRQPVFGQRLDARHVRAVRLHGRVHVRAVPVRQDRGQQQAVSATARQDRGVAVGGHRHRAGLRRDQHRHRPIPAASGRDGICQTGQSHPEAAARQVQVAAGLRPVLQRFRQGGRSRLCRAVHQLVDEGFLPGMLRLHAAGA